MFTLPPGLVSSWPGERGWGDDARFRHDSGQALQVPAQERQATYEFNIKQL